jgi:hypothetical protein
MALQCAGVFGLALALAGCSPRQIVLDDMHGDGSVNPAEPKDAQLAPDTSCTQKNAPYTSLTFVPQPAQLLILLDRSSDMQSSFGGTTREAAAQSALVNAIETFQGKIKFGFVQFPVSQCAQGTCCADEVIGPALDNNSLMKTSVLCSDPHNSSCSGTSTDSPSNAALAKVQDYVADPKNTTNDDQYVLLVTSSEPSCTGQDQCNNALSAANALGNAGVGIFVLSVGNQPDSWSCLTQIGRKGPLPRTSKLLYSANYVSDLSDMINTIFSAIARSACTLNSSIKPPAQATLDVSIGSTSVPPADWSGQNGWSASPNKTSITLSGSACDDYLSSQDRLLIGYTLPNSCNPGWP